MKNDKQILEDYFLFMINKHQKKKKQFFILILT